MKFLDKIREKPIRDRKIVLWSVLIFVGLIFIILLLYIFSKGLNDLQKSNLKEKINFPTNENLPNFEGPENIEEIEKELEEFKRAIEELEEAEKENNEQQ